MILIDAAEFRKKLSQLAKDKDNQTVFNYLKSTGVVIKERGACLAVETDWEDRLKKLMTPIQNGDIVWCGSHGLLLVVDVRPAYNQDGKHYRALKIEVEEDGLYQIFGRQRSVVIHDCETFHLRKSTFDIPAIEKLSYERYKAYSRIAEIDQELTNMKESSHVN